MNTLFARISLTLLLSFTFVSAVQAQIEEPLYVAARFPGYHPFYTGDDSARIVPHQRGYLHEIEVDFEEKQYHLFPTTEDMSDLLSAISLNWFRLVAQRGSETPVELIPSSEMSDEEKDYEVYRILPNNQAEKRLRTSSKRIVFFRLAGINERGRWEVFPVLEDPYLYSGVLDQGNKLIRIPPEGRSHSYAYVRHLPYGADRDD